VDVSDKRPVSSSRPAKGTPTKAGPSSSRWDGTLGAETLGRAGEAEFETKGVEYRVRDRREFKGKRVVVVGGGDSALEIALEIVAAAKKVILIHRREEFRAMEKNVEAVMESPIEVALQRRGHEPRRRREGRRAVVYDNRTLKKTVLDVDAVIVNIGFEPKITPCLAGASSSKVTGSSA